MKILHTADWHIGKKLHKHDLSEDFDLFIQWLCKIIEQQEVRVLIISGDVFDLANPSSEARQQYYRSLMSLSRLKCKLIITGGNHDSPAMLNAPSEILRALDIHVIGGIPENLKDILIPIYNDAHKIEYVIAAMPFLRETNLRQANEGLTYNDRLEKTQAGIEQYFLEAASLCDTLYPEIPTIAMGHLFATGAITSESEREIQIGNQAAFNANRFGNYFRYIALGHIHKPQKINAATPTYYSGSPLPLSFSERKDEKRILLIDPENTWIPKSLPIPSFRSLLKIEGNLGKIREKLSGLGAPKKLNSLLEVVLREAEYNAEKIVQFDHLISSFHQSGFEIVKHRVHFENQIRGTGEMYDSSEGLENLDPRKVFQEMLDTQNYDETSLEEIQSAFDELLEEIYSE